MDDRTTQLRKGAMDLAVLALLRQAPRYGGEIVELLSGLPGLDAGAGTVYPVLTRLRSGKLVDTSWRESTKGPPRKYYRLTGEGERALGDLSNAWRRLAHAMASLIDPPSTDADPEREGEVHDCP